MVLVSSFVLTCPTDPSMDPVHQCRKQQFILPLPEYFFPGEYRTGLQFLLPHVSQPFQNMRLGDSSINTLIQTKLGMQISTHCLVPVNICFTIILKFGAPMPNHIQDRLMMQAKYIVWFLQIVFINFCLKIVSLRLRGTYSAILIKCLLPRAVRNRQHHCPSRRTKRLEISNHHTPYNST